MIMHGSAHYLNESGEGGSYSPLHMIYTKTPVLTPIALVVFIVNILVLVGSGVGRGGKPITQLSHDFVQRLAPGGVSRYKIGQERTLGNH